MEIITLSDALRQMETHQPFDVTYVRADKRRRIAGKIRKIKGAVLTSTDYKNSIRRVKLSSGKVRPIHIRLIVEFNSKRVIY